MLKEFTTTQSDIVHIDIGAIILIESPVQKLKDSTSTLTLFSGRTLEVFGAQRDIVEELARDFAALRAAHTGVDWDGLTEAIAKVIPFPQGEQAFNETSDEPDAPDAPAESGDPREKDLGETHG